jgi:hypothetical protein
MGPGLGFGLTWQVVALVLAVIGGATFLGYSHDLGPQVVGGIYTAVLTGVLVGHYTTRAGSGGGA